MSPLWLRSALARLYNDAAADLQRRHPDEFITHATVPWDDIDESVRELRSLVPPYARKNAIVTTMKMGMRIAPL